MKRETILQTLCAMAVEAAARPTAQIFRDSLPLMRDVAEFAPVLESELNRFMRERAKSYVATLSDVREMELAVSAIEMMLTLDAQRDFDAYMQKMEWRRDPMKRFYQPRRDVLLPVVRDLQDMADGLIDFYALSLPPRVGKSTIGCFYISWQMGRNPNDANVMSGFSDKLTSSFYAEVLGLITDYDTYCFSEIFPESPLKDKNAAAETISLAHKRRFATLTCRPIGGTLTGAVEVGRKGHLYCDDMVSDYEEALNPDRMEKLYDAYLNQLRDRKLDGAKEIHIGTRWVPNDIIGMIESRYGDNPRYRFRTIPALDENGKSNFVYKHGLGFSTSYYEDMRDNLIDAGAEDAWSAKYMCSPYWKEGRLYESDDLRFFDELPEDMEPDAIYAVCDTKTRGPDYCVLVIDYMYGSDHYIQDVVCDDGLMEHIEPRMVDKLVSNGVDIARFESNVAGGKIASDVEKECRARGSAITIKTRYSTENKDTRILADSGWVKQRCLFRSVGCRDAEYERFMQQLYAYNAKSKNKHDDVPDAMSMMRRFVDTVVKARVTAFRRPW